MAIQVLVAGDHNIIRQGLCSLMREQDGFQVVGAAADGHEAVRLAKELHPRVVIMGFVVPDADGIEAARQIVSRSPDVKVLAISPHRDGPFITEIFKAGASGYLLTTCGVEELVHAIRSLADGGTYLSPEVGAAVAEALASGKTGSMAAIPLSPRQQEVLQLLADGFTVKQIAMRVKRSTKTIDMHRRHIMEKLELHTMADLTKYAIRKGLVALNR